MFAEGRTDEYCAEVARNSVISRITHGGQGAWELLGYAYFDAEFSKAFLDILLREYYLPETAPKLWEDLFADYVRDLPPMELHRFEPGIVYEFDYLSVLCAFDRDFMVNVDSAILDNICRPLSCAREDIIDVEPVKAGLTNLSVLFSVHGVQYVYRHPGDGTEEIVNRQSEAYALRMAKRLGLDDTYVFAEADEGWKISRYVPDCVPFDYRNPDHVKGALALVRRLHESGETSPWTFDFAQETDHVVKLLRDKWYPFPAGFDALHVRIKALSAKLADKNAAPVMCHNDFYGPNVLVGPDRMHLIDWEYGAMGDYGCDLGNFFAQGSGYAVTESVAVLDLFLVARQPRRRYAIAWRARPSWAFTGTCGLCSRNRRAILWANGCTSGIVRLSITPMRSSRCMKRMRASVRLLRCPRYGMERERNNHGQAAV